MIGESYRYLWEKVKDAREIHRIVPHKEEFLVFYMKKNFLVFNKTVKYPASHSSRKSYAIEIDTGPLSLILTMVLLGVPSKCLLSIILELLIWSDF